ATDRIVLRGDSVFLSNPADGSKGSLDDAAARALLGTMSFLTDRLGAATSTWRWGQLHQATFGHPFGKNRFLARWFDIGPFPAPGDGRTVFKQEFPFGGKDFPVKVGPSMRMIVSPGDRKAATSSITTGQSGHFFESHYADQSKLWLSGQGHPAWTSRGDVEANAEARMTLVPAAR
ncbi:MAG TPA: penicillin acylase family protein, partial [Candidatus Deferrimicrobiaceae bacterium]